MWSSRGGIAILWLHIGAATFGFIAVPATGNRFITGVAAPIWLSAGWVVYNTFLI